MTLYDKSRTISDSAHADGLTVTGRGTLLLRARAARDVRIHPLDSVLRACADCARSKEEHCRGLSNKEYGTSGPRAPLTIHEASQHSLRLRATRTL